MIIMEGISWTVRKTNKVETNKTKEQNNREWRITGEKYLDIRYDR